MMNKAAQLAEQFNDELCSHNRIVRSCLIDVLQKYDDYLAIMKTSEREFCARFLFAHFEEARRLSQIELQKEKGNAT